MSVVPESVRLALDTTGAQGLRFAGTSGDFSVTFDSGTGARGPTPVQMILLALGACTGMDVIGILRKQRQEVTGYEVLVHGERREEHPRSFHTIAVTHRLSGRALSVLAIEEAIRLSAAKYCSVSHQVSGTASVTNRIEILPG